MGVTHKIATLAVLAQKDIKPAMSLRMQRHSPLLAKIVSTLEVR